MAENTGSYDYERHQIDRIYETSNAVAKHLRRLAADIETTVQRAQDNESKTGNHHSTYLDLPSEIAHLVAWGIANAQVDSPARQLRELIVARESMRKLNSGEVVTRLRAFVAAHEGRIPKAGETIAHYIHMEGEDDDRHEVNHIIDTPLLQQIADLLDSDKKAS